MRLYTLFEDENLLAAFYQRIMDNAVNALEVVHTNKYVYRRNPDPYAEHCKTKGMMVQFPIAMMKQLGFIPWDDDGFHDEDEFDNYDRSDQVIVRLQPDHIHWAYIEPSLRGYAKRPPGMHMSFPSEVEARLNAIAKKISSRIDEILGATQ